MQRAPSALSRFWIVARSGAAGVCAGGSPFGTSEDGGNQRRRQLVGGYDFGASNAELTPNAGTSPTFVDIQDDESS